MNRDCGVFVAIDEYFNKYKLLPLTKTTIRSNVSDLDTLDKICWIAESLPRNWLGPTASGASQLQPFELFYLNIRALNIIFLGIGPLAAIIFLNMVHKLINVGGKQDAEFSPWMNLMAAN